MRATPKVSLIMTTFKRDHLLRITLPRILEQKVPDLEIIIVNDGTPDNTELIAKTYGCRYIFTGHRNLRHLHWRVPGFALNIGVKQAEGDIVILSCAEMYHLNDVINILISQINSPMDLAIPQGKDDNGSYLKYFRRRGHDNAIYNHLPELNTKLPFLLAMAKQTYIEIGGYDEDFIGQAFDDDDFVTRLQYHGCKYRRTKAKCVHLYHVRSGPGRSKKLHEYNRKLFEARRGIIVRNVGREWGALNVPTT